MDIVKMKRVGTSKNFYIQHNNYHFNVFHHIGWNGTLCLTIDHLIGNSWKAVPLHEFNKVVTHFKDRYTAKFLGSDYGEKLTDREQLIKFVKQHFEIELDFPVE